MEIVTTFGDARSLADGVVGLVPTMGFLHEGHLRLADVARADAHTVVMSLFVNPLQFGAGEDLADYPRDLVRDAALAADVGVDVLFAPTLAEMYTDDQVTRVVVAALTDRMEGRNRPGHLEGVATVVAKLFAGLQPDLAYFGRKDAQQLAVITRMAADLSFPVAVVGVSTVREQDGLALSSRNSYLVGDERARAGSISRALFAAADAAEAGEKDGPALEGIVWRELASAGVEAEYVELVDRQNVSRLVVLDRDAFLALAASVGRARLIDNVHLDVTADGKVTADRGRTLTTPSMLDA